METVGFYLVLCLVVAVGAWQAVCVAVWLWDKVRKPEPVEAGKPDAVQRSLECIARDMEQREKKGKSA